MGNDKVGTILNVVKFVLAILGIVLVAWVIGSDPGAVSELTVEEKEAFIASGSMSGSMNYALGIIVVGIVLIVGFFVYNLMLDTKKALKSVLGYAFAGVAFLIFYMFAGGEMTPVAMKDGIEEGTIKASEAGLYLAIFSIAVGFVAMLVSPLFRYLKN
jgi:hypothetical protein